ncbi:MAG: DUF5612 domain-containing protein [Vicinamibacterales bacterium]
MLAAHSANITYVDIIPHPQSRRRDLPGVLDRDLRRSDRRPARAGARRLEGRGHAVVLEESDGKRIVIMGGGAQVGQVALGAISEADRHNIRGERISVDTIPLVGEEALASAVRAVIRLPRVRLLVLAGSIMGGEISRAVEEVQQKGLYVISLNMAGSVPDVADLVVSDPVQAGVMAVMAIADTAKFDIVRQQKKRY